MGAGGLGRETIEAVRATNAVAPTWDLIGFLDDGDSPPMSVDGLPVLGPCSELGQLPDAMVVICTGRPGLHWSRKEVARRLDLPPERYATIVHPSAVLPERSHVSPGSVILAGVVATTAVDLGAHVTVMPGTIFTHDDAVADFATFGAGVRLAGGVTVGEGAYVGSGAVVRENRRIGAWALVGMGAVVLDDVPDAEVWVGTPARRLRSVDVPQHVLSSTTGP